MILVIIIIAVTSIVSIMAFSNRELFHKMTFDPYVIKQKKESWRFVTYALLHANWAHLLINMFVFYSFGRSVYAAFSTLFGAKAILFFLLLYVGGVIFSVLVDFGKHKNNPYYSAVGASGAVAAVVFSSILLFPTGSLFLFPFPFPIPSVVFGVLYLVYSWYMARRGSDNIGHNAHLWGSVYGIVYTIILRPELAGRFLQQIGNVF